MERNLQWFKERFIQHFRNYDIEYRYFPEGDFGTLNQINFNSNKYGGTIEFWGRGYTYIMLYDYEHESDLINVMLLPNDKSTDFIWQKLETFLNRF